MCKHVHYLVVSNVLRAFFRFFFLIRMMLYFIVSALGMKRKLSVGIALIANSKVVILDEPTSGNKHGYVPITIASILVFLR